MNREREHRPDLHHPYFERNAQSRTKIGKAIVNAYSFPILMDYGVHHYDLHSNCERMPIVQRPVLEIVAANFKPVENPIVTIDNLMVAFYRAECDRAIDAQQRRLAGLTVDRLEKQLPYIKYGIVTNKFH